MTDDAHSQQVADMIASGISPEDAEQFAKKPSFMEQLRADQKTLADSNTRSAGKAVKEWKDYKAGDSFDDNRIVVQTGIDRKAKAEELAAQVGGEVIIDDPKRKHWAVVKPKSAARLESERLEGAEPPAASETPTSPNIEKVAKDTKTSPNIAPDSTSASDLPPGWSIKPTGNELGLFREGRDTPVAKAASKEELTSKIHGAGKPVITAENAPKSKGHVAFAGKFEFYRAADGRLYKATLGSKVSSKTGSRLGNLSSDEEMAKIQAKAVPSKTSKETLPAPKETPGVAEPAAAPSPAAGSDTSLLQENDTSVVDHPDTSADPHEAARQEHAAKLDALPDGEVITGKAGHTFTAETVDGERFWKRQTKTGKYKGHLSSGDVSDEAGDAVVKKAVAAHAVKTPKATEALGDVPDEAKPKEPKFTGETVDSLGRRYHWVDGVRVPGPQEAAAGKKGASPPLGDEHRQQLADTDKYVAKHFAVSDDDSELLETLQKLPPEVLDAFTLKHGLSFGLSAPTDDIAKLKAEHDAGVKTDEKEPAKAESEAVIADIDDRVMKGGKVSPEEDAAYIKAHEALDEDVAEPTDLEQVDEPTVTEDEAPAPKAKEETGGDFGDIEEMVRDHFMTGNPSDDLLDALNGLPQEDRNAFIEREGLSNGLTDDRADIAKLFEKYGPDAPEATRRKPEEKPAAAAKALSPRIALAHTFAEKLSAGETITKDSLLKYADEAYGGTRAQGKHDPSGVYDSLEAGFNKSLEGKTDPTLDLAGAIKECEAIKAKVDTLPTQTNRSGNKDSMQQFSTPPQYAYGIAWLANLNKDDLVGEPSAGTGCIAMQAKNAGAEVVTNEFDPARAEFLADQFGAKNVSLEDGEQLGAIWPNKGVHPTAIVMNPPFSQTAGRMGDKKQLLTGANHVQQALQALEPGGRLVAIVGGGFQRVGGGRAGMCPESPTYAEWFRKLAANGYDLRANVGVSGDEYKKYGTHFGTRVLVIDKTNSPKGEIVPSGDVETIPELMTMLEGIRNDRPEVNRRAPGDGAGEGIPGAAGTGGAAEAGGIDSGTEREPAVDTAVIDAGVDGDIGSIDAPGGYPGDAAFAGGDNELVGGRPEHAGPGDKGDAEGSGVAGAEGTPGPSGAKPAKKGKSGGKAGGGKGGGRAGGKSKKRVALNIPQLVYDQLGSLRPAAPVTIEEKPAKKDEGGDNSQLGASVYEAFEPSISFAGMHKHVTPLVESAAMAAVRLPKITYRPVLSPDAVENHKSIAKLPDGSTVQTNLGLSEAGLETVALMGQAHEQWLPATGGGDDLNDQDTFTNSDDEVFRAHPAVNAMSGDGAWVLASEDNMKNKLDFPSKTALMRHLAANSWTKNETHRPFKLGGVAYRRGALNGDGTGSGKGRSVAGVLLDNVNQGRKKHVWVSKNFSLMEDARRDMADVGLDPSLLFDFKALRGAKPPDNGICFIPYTTLSSGKKDDANGPGAKNLDTLVNWLGEDFDGVIAFDEAHAMANSQGGVGMRGAPPAKMALAGIALQAAMPKARVGYWTATAATEASNLLYCDRLGLWGPGTDFPEKMDFVNELGQGGTATLEAVAQSMKSMGMYNARMVALDDKSGRQDKDGNFIGRVESQPLAASLTPEQGQMYDGAAEGWQHVVRKIKEVTEHLGGGKASTAQFWGAQQRFFNQILTCMAMPTLVKSIDEDLAAGRAPVIQLVNTMKASQDRALKNRDEDTELDEVDVGPKEILVHFLKKSFPTHRMEEYVPDPVNNPDRKATRAVRTAATAGPKGVTIGKTNFPPGAPIPRNVLDDAIGQDVIGGELVQDEHAMAEKAQLIAQAEAMKIPESPLDQLLRKYGGADVAEITGRDQRFIWDDKGEKQVEKRSKEEREGDVAAFQDGRKHVLVFSGAGNTGKSYHADARAKNQGRRVQYVLQPGWSATPLVQGLGRSNRANQTSAPIMRPVGIPEVPGNKRFISSAARRLESMGALTRGQREAASSGGTYGGSDNLETPEAVRGLHHFWHAMEAGQVPGVDFEATLTRLGYEPHDAEGEAKEPPPITQFLNRLLILPIAEQNRVFEAFDRSHRAIIEQAAKEGTLDKGMANWPADQILHTSTETIYTHPESGATAQMVTVKSRKNVKKATWAEVSRGGYDKAIKFVKNQAHNGKIWAVRKGYQKTDVDSGRVYDTYSLQGIQGMGQDDTAVIDNPEGNYKEVSGDEAQKLWDEEFAKTPQIREKEEQFVTGALLPVWKKLQGKAESQIFRLKMDTGRTIVGRHVYPDRVDSLLKGLGVHHESKVHDPVAIHAQLEAGELKHVKFSNGWKLRPSKAGAGGDTRLELKGPSIYDRDIIAQGVIKELIGGQTRFFVPTGEGGAAVLAKVAKSRPITQVVAKGEGDDDDVALSAAIVSRVALEDISASVRAEALAALRAMFPLSEYENEPERKVVL